MILARLKVSKIIHLLFTDVLKVKLMVILSFPGLNVTIDVHYTPPPDFVGGPNDYRAASTVTLTCQVEGATGVETFQWISTLPVVSNQPTMRSRTTVRSSDSGSHTCIATSTCSGGSSLTGSATIEMNVVGE